MSTVEQTIKSRPAILTVSHVRRERWLPLVVFGASVLLTCAFLAMLPARLRADEGSDHAKLYEPVARSILAGRGFASATGEFSVVYPPGYPLIIAATFKSAGLLGVSEQFGLLVLSVLATGLVSVLVFNLAKNMWGARAAVISAGLWITFPFALWLTKQPNSELPFMVFFYGGLLLLAYGVMRQSLLFFFACGLFIGLAMLVRPIAIGIPFVMCAVVLLTRTHARHKAVIMAMLLLGSIVPVLPWEALAYRRTGKIIPLSINGPRSVRDGLTYGVITKGYRQEGVVPPDVAGVMQNIVNESSDDKIRDIAAAAARQTVAHPMVMAKIVLLKVARSWYGTDSGRRELPILILQLCYLTLVGWSVSSVWRSSSDHRWFIVGTALITIYFWAMTVLVLSTFRYMLPVMPLLFVLVGAAIAKRISSSKTRRIVV